jgi:hypothetical protein
VEVWHLKLLELLRQFTSQQRPSPWLGNWTIMCHLTAICIKGFLTKNLLSLFNCLHWLHSAVCHNWYIWKFVVLTAKIPASLLEHSSYTIINQMLSEWSN